MGKLIDMSGKRFGRLKVIKRTKGNGKSVYWLCICDCGVKRRIASSSLRRGESKSCGCLQKQIASKMKKTHGKSGTRIYSVWRDMKSRCYRKKDKEYHNYGGRGIIVCDEWKYSFEKFYADMGDIVSGMSIDRINNNGNYEFSNCRWATSDIQANNRRQKGLSRNSKSGVSGVSRNKSQKYVAYYKRLHLGTFSDFFEACCARKSAEVRLKSVRCKESMPIKRGYYYEG